MAEFVRFAGATRTQLNDLASQGALLVIPLGAIEQHGPHLPTATDAVIIEHLVDRAAAAASVDVPVVVAPTLPFGSSDHHLPFGGTFSLSTETYLKVLKDIGHSAYASGFRKILFMNGHGGNHELAHLAARDIAREYAMDAGAGSWWQIAAESLQAWSAAGHTGYVPGHAGELETSLMMAILEGAGSEAPSRDRDLRAEEIRRGRARLRIELHGEWVRTDGFTDSPAAATPAAGRALLDEVVARLAAELEHFASVTEARTEGAR